MRYIDASIFVRYITQDEPRMARSAMRLFEKVDNGEDEVAVLESTIAEVVYVLASARTYALSAEEIRDRLQPLLLFEGLRMDNKSRCLRALEINAAERAISFADALVSSAALDESGAEVYSFDRDFDRIAGITRIEP
jgi:predicted nucleic acid-binding protein